MKLNSNYSTTKESNILSAKGAHNHSECQDMQTYAVACAATWSLDRKSAATAANVSENDAALAPSIPTTN